MCTITFNFHDKPNREGAKNVYRYDDMVAHNTNL